MALRMGSAMAKALGGGVAIGALMARAEVAASLVPGTHASTFGGNPLACAAGIAALTTVLEDGLLDKCRMMGEYLLAALLKLKNKYSFIKEVRGKWLMLGIELEFAGKDIVNACLDKGVLINCTMDKVLRCLPPLVVNQEEVDRAIAVLDEVFDML